MTAISCNCFKTSCCDKAGLKALKNVKTKNNVGVILFFIKRRLVAGSDLEARNFFRKSEYYLRRILSNSNVGIGLKKLKADLLSLL